MHPARSRTAGVLSLLLPLAAAACAAPGGGTTPTGAPAALPVAAYDYFRAMDYGRPLAPNEVKGRNTWILWTGGDEAFWDYMARYSYGNIDLLKTLDSRHRSYRFRYYGLMNEPGFRQATAPDRYGLWLDTAGGTEDPCFAKDYHEAFPKEQFAQAYGCSSGVLGLRLFPNPAFDDAAKARWDAKRYESDPAYYRDPDLVRPYRVGMTCGFCHIGPHPDRPPADTERREFGNLSALIGNQYWWPSRIFTYDQGPESFIYELLDSEPPGTVDTSFVSSDMINNPRTINAIFNVGARLTMATPERLAGPNLLLPGTAPVTKVPHILKDGADSVGVPGALQRVYVNIGELHEEWIKHFLPLAGGVPETPFPVEVAQRDSPYWRATADRVGDVAAYFLKAATPNPLADAPGGDRYLSEDAATAARGNRVSPPKGAACHSSNLPAPPAGVELFSPAWDRWSRTDDFRRKMTELVLRPDFLDNNYLSTDRRYPVTEIGTNACGSVATNAIRGHVWDNFSSETYKDLPAVGTIKVQDPLTGKPESWTLPAGGRGYYRSPTLVSMWATAPYFHDNTLGLYNQDPSVDGRMAAFQDAVEKLLWLGKRQGLGSVWRTEAESYLGVGEHYLPPAVVDI